MKSKILAELECLENENDMTVLYACESGSRAWGFDNPESDWDVRFIYLRNNLNDYIVLSQKPDVIDFVEDGMDIVGWDISKALRLHYTSNPNLREWTLSPIKYIDWREDLFSGLLDFDSAVLKYHYSSIAFNNWKKLKDPDLELTKRTYKMYLHNCRCILTWKVMDEGNDPSINVFDLLKQVNGLDDDIRNDIFELISVYKNGHIDDLDFAVIEEINRWMAKSIEIMRADFPKKDCMKDFGQYDERFFDIVVSRCRNSSD